MSSSQTYDDRELLLRIAEGDEQMFARFFREKSPLLLHWIRRLVKDEAGSLEVLQDVFVQIWVYRDTLPAINNLIPWLKTVATHQCFKYLTRRKAYYARSGGDITMHDAHSPAGPEAEHHLNYKEMQSIIQQALATLTPQQRQIYRLSREEGLTSDQIADRLNISRGHVRNTISAILTLLRKYLKQSGKIFFLGWLIF